MKQLLLWMAGLMFCTPALAQQQGAVAPELPAPKTAYRSMMLLDNELQAVERAVELYTLTGGVQTEETPLLGDNLMQGLQGQAAVASPIFVYPQFYLSAIQYRAPDDWVVWLNDRKLTSAQPQLEEGTTVQAVSPGEVTLLWKPVEAQRFAEKAAAGDATASFVAEEGGYRIRLFPNQTFFSYDMRTHEGRMTPVYEEKNKALPKADAPETPASASAPPEESEPRHEVIGTSD